MGVSETLNKAISLLGEKKTIQVLESSMFIDNNTVVNYIINITCKEFGVKRTDFANNIKLRNERHDAICVISHLVTQYLKINASLANIYLPVDKNKFTVIEYCEFINKLDPRIKYHKDILGKIEVIKQKVTELITI